MEIFFDKSEEGTEKGFSIMDGNVVSIPNYMKTPHMGWNNIKIKKSSKFLDGIPDNSSAYFVHSFMAQPINNNIIIASSDYGVEIPAIVEKGNFVGTQFHPEKSGKVGRKMLENFLTMCKK
jgi:glutamine amidotransferase